MKSRVVTCFSQILGQSIGEPDKLEHAYAELDQLIKANRDTGYIFWIEQQIKDAVYEKGICSYLLAQCHQALQKNKPNPNATQYLSISNIDQMVAKLRSDKESTENPVKSALLDSLITMFGSIQDYHETTRQLPDNWFQAIINKFPPVTAAIGAGLFIEELALLFAAVFVVSKGASWLEQSQSEMIKSIGSQAQRFINLFSQLAMTGLAYGSNLIYVLYNVALVLSLETQKNIVKAIMPPPVKTGLDLSAEIGLWGYYFREFEIKLIAVHLEEYIYKQSLQTIAPLRFGHTKSNKMKETLQQFKQIDASNESLETKLQKIEIALRILAYDKKICPSKSEAAFAVSKSIKVLKDAQDKLNESEPGLLDTECETVPACVNRPF